MRLEAFSKNDHFCASGGSEGLFAQKTLEITDDVLATYKNQGTISPYLPTLSLCSFFPHPPHTHKQSPFSIRAILVFFYSFLDVKITEYSLSRWV